MKAAIYHPSPMKLKKYLEQQRNNFLRIATALLEVSPWKANS
jgi:hypothetical protein